ncbi:AcrR family transcriptional regulator [Erwinia toletana]|uniref:AcrR family transcriptional regulator n=1 Tax=Winslowiella toletana TaxID=92490 RepID=A0ABS4PEW3_9GAMM|nr:TetR/AcrR family transcriptional regulator [Winslowiella toletana]MBP2171177.1 AcrR family transcriptional regulator [Winslowiella toletana]
MTPQPTARDLRHRQRQDEIIAAARRCFRRSGFHGASMAQLASEAQLSVGQIYRYFINKDAIIEEMVKRIIDQRMAEISNSTHTPKLPALLAWRKVIDEDDEALMLEVAAEATRNPRVASMLSEADGRMFNHARQAMQQEHPQFSDDKIRACVEVLAVMVEGTAFRRLTPQKASADRLYPIYQQLLKQLLETEDK